jgi:hypothetical protein
MSNRDHHQDSIMRLAQTALHSPGLLPPNEFHLARYSLNPQTRNRLLDPDIGALEDYLIDHCGLPAQDTDLAMLHAFGDVVYGVCSDINTPLPIGYQHLAWLLAWLNTHHPPSFFGEDPDSPLQALQMAAALGMGEWAAAYTQIDEGIEQLLLLANSPLWRVRFSAALGLQRMLTRAWDATVRRFRTQALVANAREWQAIVTSWDDFLLDDRAHILDTLDLMNSGLRFIRDMDEERYQAEEMRPILDAMHASITTIVRAAPQLGFSQMRVWALWEDAHVSVILWGALRPLADFPEDCQEVAALLNGD